MSPPEPNQGRTCPFCGATLREIASSCWLCSTRLPPVTRVAAERPVASEHRAAFQFSLATLMLLITLCAVVLGVFRMSAGLGFVLVLLTTPAWVRTSTAAGRRRARGQPMTLLEKLGAFAGSLGVVVIILVASGAAFLTSCFFGVYGGIALGPVGFLIIVGSLPVGIAAALYVGRRLEKRLWHPKD